MAASKREYDINDFMEIKGNPISRTGVFEYSGAQISSDLPPDQIFGVYRSEESLNNLETIESFKLIPFTDDHEMIGNKADNLTDAADKGVHGTTGETVEFDSPYLTANIKIFSEKLRDLIDNGKRELSIGYRCVYEEQNGEYDGKQYQFIQTNIRGNHLALVQEGRSGHDVSVLDSFKFTLDAKDINMTNCKVTEEVKDENEMSMSEIKDMVKRCYDLLESMSSSASDEEIEIEDSVEPADFVNEENAIDEATEEAEDETEEEKEKKDDKEDAAMDSNSFKNIMVEINARDSLAKRLSAHVGSFDHSLKTLDEVEQYGAKKLGLKCTKDTAKYVLDGYLMGAKKSIIAITQDKKIASTSIDAYLKGEK